MNNAVAHPIILNPKSQSPRGKPRGIASSIDQRSHPVNKIGIYPVSEFQHYEFVAIDKPLSIATQKKLRTITSRAIITSTRFVNTYEWGGFKGDPHALVEQHFDAFLYYANWGTRGFMLRIPRVYLLIRHEEV